MSSTSSGGSSIVTLLFWFWLGFMFFDCDDDADETNVAVTDDRPAIVEKAKGIIDEIKPEVEEMISQAKKEFIAETEENKNKKDEKKKKKITISIGGGGSLVTVENEEPENTDNFNDDDRYGDIEDKW